MQTVKLPRHLKLNECKLHNKFEVCSFSRSSDIEGVQILKVRRVT